MTRDEFWALIEEARGSDDDGFEIAERLRESLEEKPLDVILGFLAEQARVMEESYSLALWGAAHLANGGADDDEFERFRAWLLTRGRETFERVLEDPDALVDFLPAGEKAECEQMLYVGALAHEAVAGDFPEGPQFHTPNLGKGFDFDDANEMQARYPRLWERRALGSPSPSPSPGD